MAAGPHAVTAPRIGLVGTYPPTRCGIATFNASLADAITTVAPDCSIGVAACVDGPPPPRDPGVVVAELLSGSDDSRTAAAVALAQFDVAVVQHEFGIYGGPDGSEVVSLLRELTVPSIVVLHTVLRRPTPEQRRIVEQLGRLADRLVVQSAAARVRLLEQYSVAAERVEAITNGGRLNLAPEVTR